MSEELDALQNTSVLDRRAQLSASSHITPGVAVAQRGNASDVVSSWHARATAS